MSILPYGVMVAREILVLLVWVRALVRQQKQQSKFFGCCFLFLNTFSSKFRFLSSTLYDDYS